jgi:hypothetical protein
VNGEWMIESQKNTELHILKGDSLEGIWEIDMGRENCDFSTYMQGKTYCDYFDFGCFECHEIHRCPDGLDDDDLEDNLDNYDDD